MTPKSLYLATALCLSIGSATAGSPEADFTERLGAASATVHSIECDFTLTRTMSIMLSDALSEGRFYYLREAGISLDFTHPAGDRITMGGDRFLIVSSGKTSIVKVASNPMLRGLERMLTACMTGDTAMLMEGSDIDFSDEGANFVVTITPSDRRARSVVRLITLTFEKENMSLVSLQMDESSGDRSLYRFFNKKFNGDIDPARFAITAIK